jgi:3',5'-cyclic AMP phosphodiesterase CpdA
LIAAVCVLAALLAAAEPSANRFRFVILGDRTGNANAEVYARIWAEIGRERPDFVITVGDTIQGGNDATAAQEWRALRPTWERYRLPFYFTPGNHDIWSEPSRRVFERETGRPAYYGFDFRNAHFTVLDNSGSLDLSGPQMEFLARDLEQNRRRSPKFVFFHQPFWLIPVKLQSGEFPFHQLARKYGVNYVVSGHGHQFVRLLQDGVVYLEAGSAGGNLKGLEIGQGFAEGWFYSHLIARVEGDRVWVTVKEADPPFGQGRTIPAAQ